MEKRITKKVHQHFIIFKESIINKLKNLNQQNKIDEINETKEKKVGGKVIYSDLPKKERK